MGMLKVVINKCFGGFGVSKEVYKELGIEWDGYGYLHNESFDLDDPNYYTFRTNDQLIAAIEKLGVEKSSGKFAKLKIVEIPDDIEWEINEYDGIETIHEQHRSW